MNSLIKKDQKRRHLGSCVRDRMSELRAVQLLFQRLTEQTPAWAKTQVLQIYDRNSLPYSTSVLISNAFGSPSHTITSVPHLGTPRHVCRPAASGPPGKNTHHWETCLAGGSDSSGCEAYVGSAEPVD